MAKGDQNFAKQETARLGGQANKSATDLQSNLANSTSNLNSQFQAPYANAAAQQPNNYNDIMSRYQSFLGGSPYNSGQRGITPNPGLAPGGRFGTQPVNGPISAGGGYNGQTGWNPSQSPYPPGTSPDIMNWQPPPGQIQTMHPMDKGGDNSRYYSPEGQIQRMGQLMNPGMGQPDGGLNYSTGQRMPLPSDTGPYAWGGGSNTGMPPIYGEQGGWNGPLKDNFQSPNQLPGLGGVTGGGFYGGTPYDPAGGGQNPTQGSPLSNNGDPRALVESLMGGSNDPNKLRAIAPQLAQAGIKLSNPNAQGQLSKIVLPDGTAVRVIGEGEGHQVWNPQAGNWNLPGGGLSSGTQGAGGMGAVGNALTGYNNMAQTGGFSPQDIQDLRARATSPIRGIYANAQQELDRSKSLNRGVSPNYAAATSQMARQQSGAAADALTNANAGIAGMRQQGQLAGLGGLSQTGLGQQQIGLGQQQIGLGQQGLNLQGRGQDLSALQGMSGLYGTSPGAAGTYGNQYLNAILGGNANQLQMQQLLNQLNLGLIGATQTNATIPSTSQTVLSNIGKVEGMIPGLGMTTRGFA